MPQCPICGLGERCRNHWIATQDADGEIEFAVGPMTASEDNLILLQNKLGRPELAVLTEKIGLAPAWVAAPGRRNAYLAWPLELRAAVHKALFPAAPPEGDRPIPPTPTYRHECVDLDLVSTEVDAANCLPDEVLYSVEFEVHLKDFGGVRFAYKQLLWDDLAPWAQLLAKPQPLEQTNATIRLMFHGLLDGLRADFAARPVDVLCEDQPESLHPGSRVDEIARVADPALGLVELHLGEEIERRVNEARIQPMLRDAIQNFGLAAAL